MMIEQIFGGIVLFFLTLYLCTYLRREGFDSVTLFFSIVIASLWTIVLVPESANYILTRLGFYRPFDAVVAIIATSALLMTIKLYISIKKMDKTITELVRKEALDELDEEE